MEKFPSPERENENEEALGLSLEDIPEELDRKEDSISVLMEDLNETKRRQLRMIDGDLGNMRTFLQREGHSLEEIGRIDEMREKIGIALAS